MLISSLLIGVATIVLFGALLSLLPAERKIASARESFEESSKVRDKYLVRMRRDRLENSAANDLQNANVNC
jgi:hypothetical protein